MAKPDKPISFKEWVQQTIPGATSPEMKDALAKVVPSKMKDADAFTEMARRFQQPFQEKQEPPAATPEPMAPKAAAPPAPEPAAPEPSMSSPSPSPREVSPPEASTTSAATFAPFPTRRPRRGEQEKRSRRILQRSFPPDGKTPANFSANAGAQLINKGLAAEKCAGQAPADEVGLPDVSPDTAGRTMNKLGRT